MNKDNTIEVNCQQRPQDHLTITFNNSGKTVLSVNCSGEPGYITLGSADLKKISSKIDTFLSENPKSVDSDHFTIGEIYKGVYIIPYGEPFHMFNFVKTGPNASTYSRNYQTEHFNFNQKTVFYIGLENACLALAAKHKKEAASFELMAEQISNVKVDMSNKDVALLEHVQDYLEEFGGEASKVIFERLKGLTLRIATKINKE